MNVCRVILEFLQLYCKIINDKVSKIYAFAKFRKSSHTFTDSMQRAPPPPPPPISFKVVNLGPSECY